ncbi:hypothetical protein [Paenibacillus faecalis]|uniref:hypothetical protein n=1 Tax=Paenibacillus faecalis TaxID=2079532 RepID=UPI000D114AE0|nr:hypothetical protein [Paenibacillus faecalis]
MKNYYISLKFEDITYKNPIHSFPENLDIVRFIATSRENNAPFIDETNGVKRNLADLKSIEIIFE